MESALRHQRTVVLVGLTVGAVTTFRPLPLSASRFAGGLVLRTGDARYADLIERTCPAYGYPVFAGPTAGSLRVPIPLNVPSGHG
jgi:hypothetical protein